jgi:hypothetical protein
MGDCSFNPAGYGLAPTSESQKSLSAKVLEISNTSDAPGTHGSLETSNPFPKLFQHFSPKIKPKRKRSKPGGRAEALGPGHHPEPVEE